MNKVQTACNLFIIVTVIYNKIWGTYLQQFTRHSHNFILSYDQPFRDMWVLKIIEKPLVGQNRKYWITPEPYKVLSSLLLKNFHARRIYQNIIECLLIRSKRKPHNNNFLLVFIIQITSFIRNIIKIWTVGKNTHKTFRFYY